MERVQAKPQSRAAVSVVLLVLLAAPLPWNLSQQIIHPTHCKLITLFDATEKKATLVKSRAYEYYQAIRLVYRLERQLKNLQNEQTPGPRPETQHSTAKQLQVQHGTLAVVGGVDDLVVCPRGSAAHETS